MASIMIILTILSMITIWGVDYYLLARKKVSLHHSTFENELKSKNIWRILSIVISVLCIILYISLRWGNAVNNIVKHDLFSAAVSEYRSANLSIFLLLDLCSLIGVLLPILIIFDWKHKYLLRPVALLGLLGGCATVFFTTPDLYGNKWNLQTFFIGARNIGTSECDEPLMFLMHYWMIIMSLIVIVTDKKISLKTYGLTILCILTYAAYITIMSQTLDIRSHVTATVIGDFERLSPEYYASYGGIEKAHPSYEIFCEIYGVTNWKWAAVDTWVTFAVIVTIFVFIKNISYFYFVKTNLIHDHEAKFPFIDFLKSNHQRIKSLK